jgi:transcriptional regulator with XRE-family HTH domain
VTVDQALATVLRRLREESGETREALAFKAGITMGTLARVELGQADPAWSTVRAVAQALGVGLDHLGAAVEREQRKSP